MFDPTSRYAKIEVGSVTEGGNVIVYVKRRFLPQGDAMPMLQQVGVVGGDRIDNITARVLGDPEQFWRVCDANNAMYPPDLTFRPGSILRIPIPGR